MTTPRVTVIVPCRNEERYLAACLDSILAGSYPLDRLEVLVVDGCSDDRTQAIAAAYAARYPSVRLLDNPRRIVPAALNIGIEAASGDVVARMDAHVVYPSDYLSRLVAALQDTAADNVGGRIVTAPADDSAVARAIAVALSHPFGVGNSYFRIGATEPRWVDTVAFGCYRRDVFQRVGLFDDDLVRNQDDEFNHRLIRRGGRVLLLPDVTATYYARARRRNVARMYYQYGFFKPLAARKLGRVMTWRQLVPPVFLAGLGGGAMLAIVWPPAAALWGAVVVVYLIAVIGAALPTLRAQGSRCALALITVFPILHLSYGYGFLLGLWNAVVRGGRSAPDPGAFPPSR